MDEEALIARYIVEDSGGLGPSGAWLRDYGTDVWALVGYWRDAVNGDISAAARDYEVPVEAVQAALAHYRRHRESLDARIAWNAS